MLFREGRPFPVQPTFVIWETRSVAEWTAPYCFVATTLARNRPLVDHWIERWTTKVPARGVLLQGRLWIDKADINGRLTAIHVPALVIHGEEDVPIPIECALPMVEALPDATLGACPRPGTRSIWRLRRLTASPSRASSVASIRRECRGRRAET